ncbi:phenylalanine--tRNA ligase subunit beta [Mycoplasma miroungirhinis]|uniref:Phenylalanine--tRNA ligase beta subunit n=1 Tax=Mycoplasma miroungirhinis TaxID=754516 RepID=A0A6M4JDH3_9MOLU|nr:phenylalanine--tRNA ligase subunit beta [Mycoplasma miroungirhinis]QJR44116.1 phenylalanine--tRNA ligase subunit beta [Mycoplasma miroungirhinis]
MLFSYTKLKKLANLDNHISIENVVNAINSIGFEVESYQPFTDLEGLQFGHVLKTYKNPNADLLTVCEIQFADKIRTIQTNAKNVKENDYLMAFVPGSRSKKITFAPREMKGIVSEGMLAGLEEIGFNPDILPIKWNDGIFTFQTPIDLTLDPISYFELDDYIIDVTILSNRADANSYYIMAKELAAYFHKNIEFPKQTLNRYKSNFNVNNLEETDYFTIFETAQNDINISIQDEIFLLKNNIKLFSNAVNLSNLILLYTGVPSHCYDINKLNGQSISVQKYTGEVEILGNNKIQLENVLVVMDKIKPISVASVIGLQNTGCTDETENVLFEIASFKTKEIRNSKKQVKLETLSANRASKKINNGLIHLAHHFSSLYLNKASEIINFVSLNTKSFQLDETFLNNFAGFELTHTTKYQEVLKQLNILGFEIKNNWVYVPDYRFDVESMQDFSEEVFRFYGYDNFKTIQPNPIKTNNTIYKDYETILAKMGYQNVRTFTLTNDKKNIFNPFEFNDTIKLKTFASFEHSEIRNSFIHSLYDVLNYNAKRNINKLSIFEIGMINNKNNVLAIASNIKNFNQIKQDITELLDINLTFKRSTYESFHPNLSVWIYHNDKKIGYIAKLHPSVLKSDYYYLEIFLDEDIQPNKVFKKYKNESLKQRDYTFSLQQNQDIETILEKLKSLKGIYEIKVIDSFKKDENTLNVTISILIEDWAIKKLDQTIEKLK